MLAPPDGLARIRVIRRHLARLAGGGNYLLPGGVHHAALLTGEWLSHGLRSHL
jgi:hypothetical protein